MKSFVGHIINKVIKSTPRSKKVAPTIKSIKPTKDISGSVKRVTQNVTSKRIDDVNKVRNKMSTGKKMMKEAQQERKNLVDTGRAFKFRSGKEIYTITPGENPKVKFASTIAKDAGRTPTKKFKKGKELDREKKMGGGMMGRRFGMKMGTPKPKTNIEKIKATFAPKGKNLKPVDKKKNPGLSKLPTKVRNNMGYMKSGGRAGFKGGGADMTNVASDKAKKEAKKFSRRGDGVKKLNRSLTSLMNEKYMR